jgi:hypothetical protein
MSRPANVRRMFGAAKLRAVGWREHGAQWYPPWPSPFSYTFHAAQLAQAQQPQRKSKHIKEQPHD